MSIAAWKRIEPTKTTKVGWRVIVSKTFQLPDGSTNVFDIVHRDGQGFACVIALTEDKQVIVARQYRPGPERVMDDLPAGYIEPGETPEEAARRELLEESGYEASEMEYLGAVQKDAYMNGLWHGFLALNCRKITDQLELSVGEDIEVVLMTIEDFLQSAVAGNCTDAGVVLSAYDRLKEMANDQ